MQTKQRIYDKDTDFSYHPFMPILGTGLVTANGSLWQTQRLLIGPALRVDMLDEVRMQLPSVPRAQVFKLRVCGARSGRSDGGRRSAGLCWPR